MSEHLARLRPGVRRRRASTWDRTGGNADFVTLAPGQTVVLAEESGAGQLTHLWCTLLAPDPWWGRTLVLRAYWDGASDPSVEVPLGDFFGAGNGLVAPFASALLQCAPRDGLSLHSWFPMPFATGLRLEVENQGPLPVLALYCYADYELWDAPDAELGRFHAWWHRERRDVPPGPDGTYAHGVNLTGEGNYLLVETAGRGQLVGTALYVHSDLGGWYGEGDDMVWVDGEMWPPTLHGTGTEDAFGTAWSPSEPFSNPWFGQPVADRDDWAGFSSVYRWYVADPVPFTTSLRATLEHGHANDRGDDWSSVAYWYALDRPAPLPPLPPVADREPPWPAPWQDRVRRTRAVLGTLLEADDPRARSGSTYLMRAHARRDGAAVDAALGWLSDALAPWVPVADAEPLLAAWVARFDPVEAGAARVVVGVRLEGAPAYQVVVADGRCVLRPGSAGHERLTVHSDAATWTAWTDGRLDGWEAVLRGRLAPVGDTDLLVRLAALFPVAGRQDVLRR
jgi:hypothetical protein